MAEGPGGGPDSGKPTAASPTVRGMYHLFLGNTTYTFLLAITAIIVGRILGPDQYGLYTIALIVPPFLFLAIRFGLDTAATRFAARRRSEGNVKEGISFAYAMTVFELALSLVFALLFLGLSGFIATDVLNRPQLSSSILPVAIVSVVGQAAFTFSTASLTGLGRYDRAAFFQALQGAVRLITSVGLVVFGYGVLGATTGYTTAFLISGLLGVVMLASMNRRVIPSGLRSDLSTAFRYSYPVYFSSLASGAVTPVINTMLARTVVNSQIGAYTAANTFVTLITLFTYPVTTALFPLFSRKVSDQGELGRDYETANRFTALLVLPVTTFIMAFSLPLIETFYGRAYSFGAGYLALLSATSLLAGVGSLAWGALLNGVGATRSSLWATVLGFAASVLIAFVLIPTLGVYGAIIGQIIGAVASLIMATFLIQSRLGTRVRFGPVWKIYVSAIGAAVVSSPVGFLIKSPELATFGGAVIFLLFFIPFLAWLKALSEEDIGSLRRYFGLNRVVSYLLEVAIRYHALASRARR